MAMLVLNHKEASVDFWIYQMYRDCLKRYGEQAIFNMLIHEAENDYLADFIFGITFTAWTLKFKIIKGKGEIDESQYGEINEQEGSGNGKGNGQEGKIH